MKRLSTILPLLVMGVSCTTRQADTSASQQSAAAKAIPAVYHSGDILTMAGDTAQYVEALAIADGKIVYAGSKAEAITRAGRGATLIDLQGKTLLPGFIDAHGHLVNYGKNLTWAGLRGVTSVNDVITRMKAQISKTPADQWIIGFGYNKNGMAEKRPPSAVELDQVSSDRPVLIMDASGHAGSINSVLMKLVGYTAKTPDPLGGIIVRKPGSKDPLGPVDETALNQVLTLQPAATGELADRVITGAADVWAQYGQTTAMECGFGRNPDDVAIVENAIAKRLLPIDLLLCAKESETEAVLSAATAVSKTYQAPDAALKGLLAARPDVNKAYINRVKLTGVKYWLDGDLNSFWLSEPYTNNPPGVKGKFRGYGQIPDSVVHAGFDRFWKTDFQMNMHVNGDAGAEQALVAIERAIKQQGPSDHRPVFIHATYLRPDQITRLKAVGGIPSFLVASIPAAGDVAIHFFGKERAEHFAAAKSMVDAGIKFTLSHDAPVSGPPAILPLVWAAVNRTTASGVVVGAAERITPYQGLLAVTNYAAYQVKEEKSKGSLESGKLADLVILDQNPLKVRPETIKDITVLETIKEGVSVYKKP
ncbi:MAG: amidohydrolase [Gemmatimonadaceae bacterium]